MWEIPNQYPLLKEFFWRELETSEINQNLDLIRKCPIIDNNLFYEMITTMTHYE